MEAEAAGESVRRLATFFAEPARKIAHGFHADSRFRAICFGVMR